MFDIYEVEENDSLENIAIRFNTTVDALIKENNLQGEINVGTRLVIPQNKDRYFNVYTVSKGDSLYKIAKMYNINPKLLAALNGLTFDDYIYPNEEILIPKNGFSYYLTDEGDALDSVIKVFDSNKDKLLKENDTIYLMPGQLIVNKK